MNTITKMSTLPYLPTELWNKIYDYKGAMEARDEHKNAMWETFRLIKSINQSNWLNECGCIVCEERCWELNASSSFEHREMVDTYEGNMCPDCTMSKWESEANHYYEEHWGKDVAYDRFLDDLETGMYDDNLYYMTNPTEWERDIVPWN